MRATNKNAKARLLWPVLLSLVMATLGWPPPTIACALEGGGEQPDPPLIEVSAMADGNEKERGAVVEDETVVPEVVDEEGQGDGATGGEGLLALSVQADPVVAMVGDEEFHTLGEAFEKASDGDTVQMVQTNMIFGSLPTSLPSASASGKT